MNKVIFFCIVFFISAASARAIVFLEETFDYPDGSLLAVSTNWIHHSPLGSSTGEVAVASGRVLLDESNHEDVHSRLSGAPYGPTEATNVFYAGFTLRFTSLPSTSGAYFAHFKDATAGFRARIWALTGDAPAGKFRLGISSTSGSAISATNPADLSLNTDYSIMTRLANSNSVATLWINPESEDDPAVSTGEAASPFTAVSYALREAPGEGVLCLDHLRVGTSFSDVIPAGTVGRAPAITLEPLSQNAGEGSDVTLTTSATGAEPIGFQWQFIPPFGAGRAAINLPSATNSSLHLSHVSHLQSGIYLVLASNAAGTALSSPAALNVWREAAPAISLLTYNAHGNGLTNWSTNLWHVQAIGRQVRCLQPDIITFQEIPDTNTYQMPDFVTAYLPGFFLATNSESDTYIRSVVVSRFPILSSTSWLHGSDLSPYGFTNSGFTRDLFQARIAVPDWPQPLQVFTVHLKSGQDSFSAAKRAAEASAVSNFFAALCQTEGFAPRVLTGDLNEDILRPPSSHPQSIQRLVGAQTGLRLTTPINPLSHEELTFSIQDAGGLTRRYDYVLPCALLFSNMTQGEVFRTDLLAEPPAPLRTNDDAIASDHLPVMVSFADPYDHPFCLQCSIQNGTAVTLNWESVPGQLYSVEGSSNLADWIEIASGLMATEGNMTFTTIAPEATAFFRVHRMKLEPAWGEIR